MLTKVDTGVRKLLVQCDLYQVMVTTPHYKMFKGPDAQTEAELYAKSRNLEDRCVIEAQLAWPKITDYPAGTEVDDTPQPREPDPVIPEKPADPNDEIIDMIDDLIWALETKTKRDTVKVKRKMTELRKLLDRRLK